MAPLAPTKTTVIHVDGLGSLQGLEYANGVRQFAGIPYARLAKRWTRSKLADTWENNFHDGTKLGPSAPNPPEYKGEDLLTPVSNFPHFPEPEERELQCLVMNITVPPGVDTQASVPVMCYIHGGSFLYGGANRPIFDCVNLVTYAWQRGTPVVAVNFNYRVGLGGFLASQAIKEDLARDGHVGNGNFGLTDQQVALDWIQKYIGSFGGDKSEITIYGESAGGMSVSHQIAAKSPAVFHHAIAMSGILNTIPTWSEEKHETHYRALLRYLKIDLDAPDSLDQLRSIPEEVVAAATVPVEGVFVCTGNPCDDGVFHLTPPHVDNIGTPPTWLKSYMVGDVKDEAMIFRMALADHDYNTIMERMRAHLSPQDVEFVLGLYGVSNSLPVEEVRLRFEELASNATFITQDYLHVHNSRIPKTYGYHFDQVSTLDNALNGLAYHALDLLYLFLNLREEMSPAQIVLAEKLCGDWIDFAYGKDPFEPFSVNQRWMVYGPNDTWGVKTEPEDEEVRQYSRMKEVLEKGIFSAIVAAVDDITVHRTRMGAF